MDGIGRFEKITKIGLSAFYKTVYCAKCGYFEIPAKLTVQKMPRQPKTPVCLKCGSKSVFRSVGRFVYKQTRNWRFKKGFYLVKFIPGKDKIAGERQRQALEVEIEKSMKKS